MSASSSYVVGVRINGDARGLSRAAQEALRAQRLLAGGSVREYQRMADARKTLGVRSEREVQREIAQTQAAYNRLARSGTLSWQEQRMAARGMRQEVTRLTNEMGRLTKTQQLVRGGKVVGAVGAGVGATTALIAPKVNKAMEYDERMRRLTTTAYNDRDLAGLRQGLTEMKANIAGTVRSTGAKRDDVVGVAEEFYGSGRFNPGQVNQMMRQVAEASVATGGAAGDFAKMAIAANQSMRIKPEDMRKQVYGPATYAGQQGGFEISDMARYLPEQMSLAGSMLGMRGPQGVAKLVALNQAAVNTAGSRDQAGNNVVNLLSKMGSEDTVKDFRKQGIDLRREYAQGAVRGKDAVDVLGELLDKQFSKDKNLQAARTRLKSAAPGSEREAALDSVSDIAKGANIAKVFQDRQALAALLGYMNDRERVRSIAEQAPLKGEAALDKNYAFIQEGPEFAAQRRRNAQEASMQSSMDKLTPTIGFMNDKLTTLMQQYPGYTTAIYGATFALTGLATAAAALAFLGLRMPGGFGGGPTKGAPLPGAAPSLGQGTAKTGVMSGARRYLGALGKASGGLSILGLGYELFGTTDDEIRILKQAEQSKHHRGAGFDDPRLLTRRDGGAAPSPATGANILQRTDLANLPAPELFNTIGNRWRDKNLMAQLATPLAAPGGYRGAGFDDPRLLTRAAPQSLAERLGSIGKASDRAGEITVSVNVSAAPGLNVQAEAKSKTPGLSVRADSGRTMQGMGH